ncbi:Synaptotagmin-7 [Hordeum vulgare]|nr:Synaptotagmin-7 [Hordeum vulgare]
MGRSKSNLEESDVADLLTMKGEFIEHREETADMRGEVDDQRKDVHSINLKQDTMVTVLDEAQKAVSTLSSQLSTMADVLRSLRSRVASSSAQ